MEHGSEPAPPASRPGTHAAGIRTPFADAVLRLRGSGRPEADVVSFHALPWSQGRAVQGGPLVDKYHQLFGREFLASEMTYSGAVLDSFFQPSGPLDLAQQLAAEAFGSDHTFFVTCGTTTANHVAVDALDSADRRLLVDRMAHHSIHVAAGRAMAAVDYTPCTVTAAPAGQPLLDVAGMLRMLAEAHRQGHPYHAVVLAGSSYDGLLYDLPAIMRACLRASPSTTAFLADEAWSAINAFHAGLRPLSALAAAADLAASDEPVDVLVTQSAHKSMAAARQGSYLHVTGDRVTTVRACLYGRHSTSPSIPILASLDLARAHAQAGGERLLQRSIALAEYVAHTIATDPTLRPHYAVAPSPVTTAAHRRYFATDPTKIRIDVTNLGISGEQARARLFGEFRIYVARTFPAGFLLNFHIGTDENQVDRLLEALRSMAHQSRGSVTGPLPDTSGAPVDGLVVAYPPGVPVAVPGDLWTEQHQHQLESFRQEGSDIYTLPIPNGRSRHRLGNPG